MPILQKPLFRLDALKPKLDAFKPAGSAKSQALGKWRDLIVSGKIDKFKETEILPDFISDIFQNTLGYHSAVDNPDRHTILRENLIVIDGKRADAALGVFNGDARFLAVLEGKGPLDPLDRPFAGRKMSAVDQGFRYAINLKCDWVLVTNLKEIRLYHKGNDYAHYERFETALLADDDALRKRFLFLLGAERVVRRDGSCHLPELLSETERIGQQVTVEFYQQYAGIRQHAFDQLCMANPNVPKTEILKATQKLLDRILFCTFAENRGLLPPKTITAAYAHRDKYNPRPIWETFRGLFRSIDVGNPGLEIEGYNGGLFAPDALLDGLQEPLPRPLPEAGRGENRSATEPLNLAEVGRGEKPSSSPPRFGEGPGEGFFASPPLTVPDKVCQLFTRLADYDYRDGGDGSQGRPVDVEILGHIFEQSISDLERLHDKLEGRTREGEGENEPSKGRRKKEGAFYTPAFITRYIVAQTLGPVIRERFTALKAKYCRAGRGFGRPAAQDRQEAGLPKPWPALPEDFETKSANEWTKPQKKELVRFWQEWQDVLSTIRILDPACGSGAFLIEAFNQLHREYDRANAQLRDLGEASLFDPDTSILQKNLYGVDLNEEAIEICRLSLWIKTARHGHKLTSLDHTIVVGNSIVNDPAVHPRAFDWDTAFPEVMADGGFDVVVGNPPYIRQEWLAPYKPHWQATFASFNGIADIYTYFYELGIKRLRPDGRLGFITSGSWVRGNFGSGLRGFLAKNARLESMVDFGEYQPFEDAEMIRPSIAVFRKAEPGGSMRLFKWLTVGEPPKILTEVIATAPTMRTDHLGEDTWELESDDVLALRKKLAANRKTLGEFAYGGILRGVLSGLTEVYVVDSAMRDKFVAEDQRSAEILKPFLQGTHLRPWYNETSGDYLLAIASSSDRTWPWSSSGENAEEVFAATYPAIHSYLNQFREQAIKRTDQGQYWWEMRSCSYWSAFEQPKIIWPDISKLPRFSFDDQKHVLGNTCYFVPGGDYYLLGILSSWATWFYLSKTAQPLRLRDDRWQYRLFTQFMERIPIPEAPEAEQIAIAELAKRCRGFGIERYRLETNVGNRMSSAWGQDAKGKGLGKLNQKAEEWWEQPFVQLGAALKTSFKLTKNPFQSPKTADEWEPYLRDKKAEHDALTKQLADAEAEINDRVYRLFDLTKEEIALLQREVEH